MKPVFLRLLLIIGHEKLYIFFVTSFVDPEQIGILLTTKIKYGCCKIFKLFKAFLRKSYVVLTEFFRINAEWLTLIFLLVSAFDHRCGAESRIRIGPGLLGFMDPNPDSQLRGCESFITEMSYPRIHVQY